MPKLAPNGCDCALILGCLQLSSATAQPSARRAGERARELVDQILTFGRRGEGRRERLGVAELVAETRSLLAASLPSHVKLAVSETTQTTAVWAEPAQLQQVILNLCNNAAQAMDQPGLIELHTQTQIRLDAPPTASMASSMACLTTARSRRR